MAMKAPMTASVLRPSLPPREGNAIASFRRPLLRTSGSLRVVGIKSPMYISFRCQVHGGGNLGSQMNLFDRLARIIKSFASAILDVFEDPEKILEQSVADMNNDLIKMRQTTAQVLASQKRLENTHKAAQQKADDWYVRAQLALKKGDEDLAREALKMRKSSYDNANSLKLQLDQRKGVVDSLLSNTRLLESRIQEARSKKDNLKARALSAKTATKINEMLGNIDTSSALAAFEKMEEKVLAMETQAEAFNQLTTDDLEGKFALLESSSVDDDLEKLKRDISRQPKGELPPGRTPSSGPSRAHSSQDIEIENALNEMRTKFDK